MAETKPSVPAESKTPQPPESFRPFETLRRQIDRLFEDFSGEFARRPFGALADFGPFWGRSKGEVPVPIDVVEKDDAFEITAELPGLAEKDVDVSVANGAITIRGEKSEHREERKADFYMSERRYGSFVRSFRLPEGVDSDKIDAHFAKGVLTVTLPKTAQARSAARSIPIRPK